MAVKRIANRDAAMYVRGRVEFQGSNLYARWDLPNGLYCVFSYGEHFPLAVWDGTVGRWFHNTDRYSPTTSKHASQASTRGLGEGKDARFMRDLVRWGGIVNMVDLRLAA